MRDFKFSSKQGLQITQKKDSELQSQRRQKHGWTDSVEKNPVHGDKSLTQWVIKAGRGHPGGEIPRTVLKWGASACLLRLVIIQLQKNIKLIPIYRVSQ